MPTCAARLARATRGLDGASSHNILDGLHGLDKHRHLLPLGLDGAQCRRHHIHGRWLLQVPATRCEPKEPAFLR